MNDDKGSLDAGWDRPLDEEAVAGVKDVSSFGALERKRHASRNAWRKWWMAAP